MQLGGQLTITAVNVSLDEDYAARNVSARPGEYVMLAVRDNGTGIDEEQSEHIFEPFYTTKELGKGTGLGLATVYGIVKQSNGHLRYKSEVGTGSTFKIYLPRVLAADGHEAGFGVSENETRGPETILIVEDEEMVRKLGTQILSASGYKVIQASSGAEALNLFKNDSHIHFLVTHVIMPNMSGRQLA